MERVLVEVTGEQILNLLLALLSPLWVDGKMYKHPARFLGDVNQLHVNFVMNRDIQMILVLVTPTKSIAMTYWGVK